MPEQSQTQCFKETLLLIIQVNLMHLYMKVEPCLEVNSEVYSLNFNTKICFLSEFVISFIQYKRGDISEV